MAEKQNKKDYENIATSQKNNKESEDILDKILKKEIKRYKIRIASSALLIAVAIFGGPVLHRSFTNDLPKISDVEDNLNETGYWTDIALSFKSRFVFPASGVVKINVKIPEEKLTDKFKTALEDAVAEMNEVLYMIEPKYSLELNYDPNIFDEMYCVNLKDKQFEDSSEDDRVVANAQTKDTYFTINGGGKYKVEVNIDLDYFNQIYQDDLVYHSIVKNALCHEILGHAIGSMGDAYLLEDYPYRTMMSYSDIDNSLSKSDLMILFSLYSNNTDYGEWERKIDKFLSSRSWNQDFREFISYVKETFYDSYVVQQGLEEYIKPEDIAYEDIGDTFYLRNNTTKSDYIKRENEEIIEIQKFANARTVNSENDKDYLYNVDGSICRYPDSSDFNRFMFIKVGEDTMVEVRESYFGYGINFTTYDVLDKEIYEKETSILKKACDKLTKNNQKTYLSDVIIDYLNKNDIDFEKIASVNNYSTGVMACYKSVDIYEVEMLYYSFKIDGSSQGYILNDGIIIGVDDRTFLVATSTDQARLFSFKIDYEKGEYVIDEIGYVYFSDKDKFSIQERALTENEKQ